MNDQEPEFDAELIGHLQALNRIISQTHGTPGEVFRCIGNLFYDHATDYPVDAEPYAGYRDKRAFYAAAVKGRRSVLEVGFNAGHSALLALWAQPGLTYTGVDICHTAYTIPCAEYLAQVFKHRFTMFKGDSREILPRLATHHRERNFDTFHIDGDHAESPVRTDISNLLRLAPESALVILDDIDFPGVAKAYNEFVELGRLRPATLKGFEESRRQAVAIAVSDKQFLQPNGNNT
ncbi:MAG: class I SAM-dependent methyltransferase [Rhodospirillaceae bacterium]|nr:class I SAM-dependent methyltransferase [Rhodospirillaceae bacterium]